jgi:hypothetical protein
MVIEKYPLLFLPNLVPAEQGASDELRTQASDLRVTRANLVRERVKRLLFFGHLLDYRIRD